MSLDLLPGLVSHAASSAPSGTKLSETGSASSGREPDPDTIKMFVGQVSRTMTEQELVTFFQEFGPVHELNVLRDKGSGQSRGCCFVTYCRRQDALQAQHALHNLRILPEMHHPIQMKPADTENRNERKLFVGMVSKKLKEDDIRKMFQSFGPIEDCSILRDDNGVSRGCAFVTFGSRQVATVAIKAMHHSQTMDGCSSPLVVKFADTQKEKEQKKLHQLQSSLWSLAPPAALASAQPGSLATPHALTLTQGTSSSLPPLQLPQLIAPSQQLILPYGTADSLLAAQLTVPNQTVSSYSLPYLHALGNLGMPSSQLLQNLYLASPAAVQQQQQQLLIEQLLNDPRLQLQSSLGTSPYLQLSSTQALLTSLQASAMQKKCDNPAHSSTPPFSSNLPLSTTLPSLPTPPCLPASSSPTTTSSTLPSYSLLSSTTSSSYPTTNTMVKSHEGPDGANLFIYHLPPEFSDSDLLQTFLPFGSVVSAKVFVDKQTNLSKCFGFVSYRSKESAQNAIQALNGFHVGTKRLKVQLKKARDKPY